MSRIASEFRQNGFFLLGFLIFLVSALFFLLGTGKAAAFISLNSYHPFWLNVFFINYTFMGDGIFAVCLTGLAFFYFRKKQLGFSLLYSFLVSGIAVQVIKNLVSAPRPRLFFEPGQYLFFMDGVSLANNSSFPSGHTATAFAIATTLVLITRNRNWQLPLLAAAILVGYSRIYLAQHFLLDVLIGSLIGVLSGIFAVYLAYNGSGIRSLFRLPKAAPDSPATIQTA